MKLTFLETKPFTKWVLEAFPDSAYRSFQNQLLADPLAGDLIPGGGGLRKIRVGVAGKGKRGGARVIYYYASKWQQILFLYAYDKNAQGDLTSDQMKVLGKIVRQEYPKS